MLKFLCPNGHPLSAPENLAGRSGKCPKCGAAFVVPQPEENGKQPDQAEAEQAQPAAMGAGAAAATGGSSPVMPAMGSGKGQAVAAGEIFVFLCPNGHKLNGPPSMKGKPGQCPHCGARFRIPTDEDLEEEEVPLGEADEEGEPADGGDLDFNRLFGGQAAEEGSDEAEEVAEGVIDESVAPPPAGAAGLGYIVGRLWERRTEGAQLEVFLAEGEIVAPDFYSEALSSSDYGVFATQEGDGTFAVTVVPWSTVRRIGMRHLGDLSPDMFS
jgi:hypothetical protein